ncbi:MAG: cupin domain-containing protein [Bacteroidales bacterium]|nr:cupin domain-containing protein [Bacteroidales bacterium]
MKLIEQNSNFAMASVGKFSNLEGKHFVKDLLQTTSMEVSITSLAPGEKSLYHQHRQNEELFIIVAGIGLMLLDGEYYKIEEGSLIRVAPSIGRGLENNGVEPLKFICIQAKVNSLEGYTLTDGNLVKQ